MLYTSPASSWPWVAPLIAIASCAKNRESIFGEWCNVRMPRLSSLLQGSTSLLRVRLVHVCVTEYDRATSNYLEPLHARKVARAVERQLKPIAARSVLKSTNDLVPSCSATDSRSVEGKLGRCVVVVGDSGSDGCVELGDLAEW